MNRFFFFLLLLTLNSLVAGAMEASSVYQYFFQSKATNAQAGSGAYLWIPPETEKIRAVLVGLHNGLPASILENNDVRRVCSKHAIAQILFTPNGSEIGPVMMRNLRYDFTDPERTAIYDAYLADLAELSGHPELTNAPIVPMAHSAYCSFPFEAAMRNPSRCLAAVPIKAGLPDVYKTYWPGGDAMQTSTNFSLSNVPILFISSATQETVTGQWKSESLPHKIGNNPLLSIYRQDTNASSDVYIPRNEEAGICHDPNLGHFNMLPRDYAFVADWLDDVAAKRLPSRMGDPLITIQLKEGWLVNGENMETNTIPPAPYAEFTGKKNRAYWYPSEKLALNAEALVKEDFTKHQDFFTVLGVDGKPYSLAESPGVTVTNAYEMMTNDGLIILTTHHDTAPPDICTNRTKGHETNGTPHAFANVLFPDKSELVASHLPLSFDLNLSPLEVLGSSTSTDASGVSETTFILGLRPNRLSRSAGLCVPMICHEGDQGEAAACRSVMLKWGPKPADWGAQRISFPPIADIPRTQARVELKAASDKNLPVNYYVQKGPGVIEGSDFVVKELPLPFSKPIEVTVGASSRGYMGSTGPKTAPSDVVFQTFRITP